MSNVRVSYLMTSSGPAMWGAVGSLVTEPGDGRYVILRRLVPGRGPEGYFVVSLVTTKSLGTFDTEKEARAFVARHDAGGGE